jgi:hypothetical protein
LHTATTKFGKKIEIPFIPLAQYWIDVFFFSTHVSPAPPERCGHCDSTFVVATAYDAAAIAFLGTIKL